MTLGEYKLIKVNGTSSFDEKTIQAVSGKVLGFDVDLNPVMTDGGGTGVVIVHQVAHGLSVGNPIRVSGANTYAKAQADTAANAEVCGFVTIVTGDDDFTYSLPGYIILGVPAQTASTVMFLSDVTAGALMTTDPPEGSINKPLLIIIENAAKALFFNFRGFVVGGSSSTPAPAIGSVLYLYNNYGGF